MIVFPTLLFPVPHPTRQVGNKRTLFPVPHPSARPLGRRGGERGTPESCTRPSRERGGEQGRERGAVPSRGYERSDASGNSRRDDLTLHNLTEAADGTV